LIAAKTRNRMKRNSVLSHPSVSCPSCFRGLTSDSGFPLYLDLSLSLLYAHRRSCPAQGAKR
jgi:hypothetical protein